MSTQIKMIHINAELNRLNRLLAQQKWKARKLDTRRKIELGGLVIKGGLADYPKHVILGAIVDAVQQIQNDIHQLEIYAYKGEKAFMD